MQPCIVAAITALAAAAARLRFVRQNGHAASDLRMWRAQVAQRSSDIAPSYAIANAARAIPSR
jgi:hypothetical protein